MFVCLLVCDLFVLFLCSSPERERRPNKITRHMGASFGAHFETCTGSETKKDLKPFGGFVHLKPCHKIVSFLGMPSLSHLGTKVCLLRMLSETRTCNAGILAHCSKGMTVVDLVVESPFRQVFIPNHGSNRKQTRFHVPSQTDLNKSDCCIMLTGLING